MAERGYIPGGLTQEFVMVENIRLLVCLLDLTADFGVKASAKLTPNCQLRLTHTYMM